MKKTIAWIAVVGLLFAFNTGQAEQEEWFDNYVSPMDLQINHIDIQLIQNPVDSFKKGSGDIPGTLQATEETQVEDCRTHRNGGTFYTFSAADTIDHVIVYCDGQGIYPHAVSFAFAWQPCGNGVIVPPIPTLMGTIIDRQPINVTIPFEGCYLITVGVYGFDEDEWDWMVMGDYVSGGSLVNPMSPVTDTFGGSRTTFALYNGPGDAVGHGFSSARPWCFNVGP